jgi:hypothetical protein
VSQRASKLRPSSARGGVLRLACACWLFAVPANAWAGESTQLQVPDAPPLSAAYLPAPDAPPSFAASARTTLGVHASTPAKAAAPKTYSHSSTSSARLVVTQPAARTPSTPVRSGTTPTKSRATPPARTGRGSVARPATSSALTAPKKLGKGLVSTVRRTRLVVPHDPPRLDRNLLAMGGVLLGVAAIGAAVLGGGIRHVLREGRP